MSEWRFKLMMNRKAFNDIPNWLDVNGQKIPVIVSGRKPAYWHCGEKCYLSTKKTTVDHQDVIPCITLQQQKEKGAVSM